MAIFQPSFITPDRRNGLGNGTIDATQNLTVSWRVNGPSALQYFSISIYSNDAASTELYTTGKISDGCPFYGTTNTGEIQFFSYTIPAATLSSNGITNGNEYKIIIEQWWSANDSVVQSSASVFITRDAPTVVTEGWLIIVESTTHNFQATYTQAQGDTLNWFRWQIERVVTGGNNVTVFDSGEISGTEDVSCTFDGFLVDVDYQYTLTVQTENGVTATSGGNINVFYETETVVGSVTAECQKGTSAVKVDFSGITSIPGEASGTYSFITSTGEIRLEAGASVTWNRVSNYPMHFAPQWYAVVRIPIVGGLDQENYLFEIGQPGGNIKAFIGLDEVFSLQKNGVDLIQANLRPGMSPGISLRDLRILITPSCVYIKEGLLPDVIECPIDQSIFKEVTSAIIYGGNSLPRWFASFEIFRGTPSQDFIDMFKGNYVERSAPFYMSATFDDTLNAGLIEGDLLDGYSVYREVQQGTSSQLVPVCRRDARSTVVYDYGVKNQVPYKYYVFPESDTQILTQGIISNMVAPCWWDWSLMECQATTDKNIFTVLAEYRFSNNISTTAMSNNNRPNVLQNFTQYPTVQISQHNYKSGVLQGLIGSVDNAAYSDSVELMEKLYALPLSSNPFFLKDRKGHLMRVRISDEITMQTGDNNVEQPQTISLPWVEVGSAEGVSLWALNNMSQGV